MNTYGFPFYRRLALRLWQGLTRFRRSIQAVVLCSASVGVLLFSAPVLSQERALIVGHDYHPYYNRDGQGLASDLYRAAFNAAGVESDIQSLPIKRGVMLLLKGMADANSPGLIFIDPEDHHKIESVPIMNLLMCWFYYRPNHPDGIASGAVASFSGRKIGVIENSFWLDRYLVPDVEFIKMETPEQLVGMTQRGRIDFFETTLLTGLLLIKKMYPDDWHQFSYIPKTTLEPGLAFLKGNPRSESFRKRYEVGLDRIMGSGEYMRIMEQYWGTANVPKHVLPPRLQHVGVEKLDLERFNSPVRNRYGKIE